MSGHDNIQSEQVGALNEFIRAPRCGKVYNVARGRRGSVVEEIAQFGRAAGQPMNGSCSATGQVRG